MSDKRRAMGMIHRYEEEYFEYDNQEIKQEPMNDVDEPMREETIIYGDEGTPIGFLDEINTEIETLQRKVLNVLSICQKHCATVYNF